MLKDPHHTIEFDRDLHNKIISNTEIRGTDAQRIQEPGGSTRLVNLTEKLLVPLLAKISNFIPGAGIWMNTQRPEWNDANNALVGFGVSMVTLYYMRDHINYLLNLFAGIDREKISVSEEVDELFSDIYRVFIEHKDIVGKTIRDNERKEILDKLGDAAEKYREKIYDNGFSGERMNIAKKDILGMLNLVLTYIDHSIDLNKRNDGLYHAYNVIGIKKDSISIRHLYEMLEGQVALLSSGYLSGEESVRVLRALRSSQLYRADQRAYILYPNRTLPRFREKNIIPGNLLKKSKYLQNSAKAKDPQIIKKDAEGLLHFNAAFSNGRLLKQKLEELDVDPNEIDTIMDIYESVFDHQSFTGRAGTFINMKDLAAYTGIWHQSFCLLFRTHSIGRLRTMKKQVF